MNENLILGSLIINEEKKVIERKLLQNILSKHMCVFEEILAMLPKGNEEFDAILAALNEDADWKNLCVLENKYSFLVIQDRAKISLAELGLAHFSNNTPAKLLEVYNDAMKNVVYKLYQILTTGSNRLKNEGQQYYQNLVQKKSQLPC